MVVEEDQALGATAGGALADPDPSWAAVGASRNRAYASAQYKGHSFYFLRVEMYERGLRPANLLAPFDSVLDVSVYDNCLDRFV